MFQITFFFFLGKKNTKRKRQREAKKLRKEKQKLEETKKIKAEKKIKNKEISELVKEIKKKTGVSLPRDYFELEKEWDPTQWDQIMNQVQGYFILMTK